MNSNGRWCRVALLRAAVPVLALAALTACGGSGQPSLDTQPGGEPAAGPDTAAGSRAAVDTAGAAAGAVPSGCADLHYNILKAVPTRQAFSAEFGQPDSVVSTVEPNRHVPGAIDSLFTVHYPRFVMDIRTPSGGRDMATEVHLEDNRYLAYPGIGIGASAARVREVLGDPHDEGPAFLTYQCSEHVEQPVTFRVADGRVAAIEIAYYVD